MGSGGYEQTKVPKRDAEPEYLTNLRDNLLGNIMPGLESFDPNDWQKARETSNNALQQQAELMSHIPASLNRSSSIADEIASIARTGNVPSGLMDNMNASVNKELQSNMGTMLNNLANRGVVNSSIMAQGVDNLSQQAADAYAKNYLTAYQAALSGMGNALQGQQSNTNALTTGIYALGKIPSQAYEGVGQGLTTAYNMWKAMQNSYDTREDYDTVVTQKSSSCITGDTKVRLKDGREIPVFELKESDEICVWDFEKGCVTAVPMTAFFRQEKDDGAQVIRIEFDDNSNVGVIKEHLFFDLTLGEFVAINADSMDFIGHEFARVRTDGKVEPVKVKRIYENGHVVHTFAPHTGELNFLANGFISGNDGQLGLCNRFLIDKESMKYDTAEKIGDIAQYGLLDYDGYKDIVSKEFFDRNHFKEFSVAFGKGLLNETDFKAYLKELSHCFLI